MKISRTILVVTGAFIISLTSVSSASAVRSADETVLPEPTVVSVDDGVTNSTTQEWRTIAEKRIAEAKEKAEAIKAEAQERQAQRQKINEKLSAAKQRVCQSRQTVIANVMTRINDRGQRRLDTISTISARVQEFKTAKQLAVADYEMLVSAVESSRLTAQAAVDTVKNTQVEFTCDGNDPKGVANAYQQAVKAQNDTLRAYRDAVKDLVAAVKQAALPSAASSQSGRGEVQN